LRRARRLAHGAGALRGTSRRTCPRPATASFRPQSRQLPAPRAAKPARRRVAHDRRRALIGALAGRATTHRAPTPRAPPWSVNPLAPRPLSGPAWACYRAHPARIAVAPRRATARGGSVTSQPCSPRRSLARRPSSGGPGRREVRRPLPALVTNRSSWRECGLTVGQLNPASDRGPGSLATQGYFPITPLGLGRERTGN
jgi:hypothetical protein